MRNRAIFASGAPSAKRESGQKEGTHDQRTRANRPAGPEPRKPATSGHPKRQAADHLSSRFPSSLSKICLDFALFGLRKSRENTNDHQIKICFCPFLPCLDENLPRWKAGRRTQRASGRQEDSGRQGTNKSPCAIWRAYEKGTPPLLTERQVPSTLIIFRTKKVEKSSPWQDWKKFVGKCFGGKGKPPILWKGGEGVLKYERLVQR